MFETKKGTITETEVNIKEKADPITIERKVWDKLLVDIRARGISVHCVAVKDTNITEITLGK